MCTFLFLPTQVSVDLAVVRCRPLEIHRSFLDFVWKGQVWVALVVTICHVLRVEEAYDERVQTKYLISSSPSFCTSVRPPRTARRQNSSWAIDCTVCWVERSELYWVEAISGKEIEDSEIFENHWVTYFLAIKAYWLKCVLKSSLERVTCVRLREWSGRKKGRA